MPTRLLVIGLESVEHELAFQWSDAGHLPNLKRLLHRGVFGKTSVPGDSMPAGGIWPSFMTGLNPAKHGRYGDEQIVPGSYNIREVLAATMPEILGSTVPPRPFWQTLSDAGRRVAVIDVPESLLCTNINGLHLVDWMVHGQLSALVHSHPPEVAEEAIARFGSCPIDLCRATSNRLENFDDLLPRLLRRVERKAKFAVDLLARDAWDLFLVVFAEGHCAGHKLWQFHDPAHPFYPSVGDPGRDPLFDVYKALDNALGRLLDQIDDETIVLVLTVIGMGPNHSASFLLDDVLLRLERKQPAKSRVSLDHVHTTYRALVPAALRTRFGTALRGVAEAAKAKAMAQDWSQRKAFVVPNNETAGAIRLNLIGREPKGRLSPGEEAEAYCRDLSSDLRDLINIDTGKPVVRDVIRTAEVFQGERLDNLPDLYVLWNSEAPINRVASAKTGEVTRERPEHLPGNHRPRGLFLAAGPGFLREEVRQPTSILDFAPTICALLDVELGQFDGTTIPSLCPTVD